MPVLTACMAGGASFSTVQSAGFDATLNGANPAVSQHIRGSNGRRSGDDLASGGKRAPRSFLRQPMPPEAGRSDRKYVQRVGRHTQRSLRFLAARIFERMTRGRVASTPVSPTIVSNGLRPRLAHVRPAGPCWSRSAGRVSGIRRQPALHRPGGRHDGNDPARRNQCRRAAWGALFSQVNAIFRIKGCVNSATRTICCTSRQRLRRRVE